MKKLLIFALTLTFMAQASVSFAETIWKDSSTLADRFGVTSTNRFSSFNDINNSGAHGMDWGTDGRIWAYSNELKGNTVGRISWHLPEALTNPNIDLKSMDYVLNINFGQNTGIAGMSATMRIDRVMNGDVSYFIIDPANMSAFSKTFIVDGIEYETRLSAPTLKDEELAWAQNYLNVGSDVTIFGWTAGYMSQGSVFFDLQTGYQSNAVPVPAAVWLMGSGLAGLMALKRKNSAK